MLSDVERNCWPLRMRDARERWRSFCASPMHPVTQRKKKLQQFRRAFAQPKSAFRTPASHAFAWFTCSGHQAHN